MGAMCDPVFDVTVTCPECGRQEFFRADNYEILNMAGSWYLHHCIEHEADEEEE